MRQGHPLLLLDETGVSLPFLFDKIGKLQPPVRWNRIPPTPIWWKRGTSLPLEIGVPPTPWWSRVPLLSPFGWNRGMYPLPPVGWIVGRKVELFETCTVGASFHSRELCGCYSVFERVLRLPVNFRSILQLVFSRAVSMSGFYCIDLLSVNNDQQHVKWRRTNNQKHEIYECPELECQGKKKRKWCPWG